MGGTEALARDATLQIWTTQAGHKPSRLRLTTCEPRFDGCLVLTGPLRVKAPELSFVSWQFRSQRSCKPAVLQPPPIKATVRVDRSGARPNPGQFSTAHPHLDPKPAKQFEKAKTNAHQTNSWYKCRRHLFQITAVATQNCYTCHARPLAAWQMPRSLAQRRT